jgi:hypothetical protein
MTGRYWRGRDERQCLECDQVMPTVSRATYCGGACRTAAYRRRRATPDTSICHNDDYGRCSEDCWGAGEHPRPLIRATHCGAIALSCIVRLGAATTDRLSLGRLRRFAGLWNPDRCSRICAHRSSVARAVPELQSCGDGTFHDLFRHDEMLGVHRPAGVFVESGNSCSLSKAKIQEGLTKELRSLCRAAALRPRAATSALLSDRVPSACRQPTSLAGHRRRRRPTRTGRLAVHRVRNGQRSDRSH